MRREMNEMKRMQSDLRRAEETAGWMDRQSGMTTLSPCLVRALEEYAS